MKPATCKRNYLIKDFREIELALPYLLEAYEALEWLDKTKSKIYFGGDAGWIVQSGDDTKIVMGSSPLDALVNAMDSHETTIHPFP